MTDVVKCVHPYAKVEVVAEDGFYDEGPVHRFTVCWDCREILEGEIPDPIPYYWERDHQKLARAITGYEIEPVPPPRPRKPGESCLGDILEAVYKPVLLEMLENLREPSLGHFFKVKTNGE